MKTIEQESLTKEEINNAYYYSEYRKTHGEAYRYDDEHYTCRAVASLEVWTIKEIEEEYWTSRILFFKKWEKRKAKKEVKIVLKRETKQSEICSTKNAHDKFIKSFEEEIEKTFDPFKELKELLSNSTKKAFQNKTLKQAEALLKEEYEKVNYLKLENYQQEILSYLSQ